jgi:hypothetical protein
MARRIELGDGPKNYMLGSVLCPTCFTSLGEENWLHLNGDNRWWCTDKCESCGADAHGDKFVKLQNPRTPIFGEPLHPKLVYFKSARWWEPSKDWVDVGRRNHRKPKSTKPQKPVNQFRNIDLSDGN